VRDSLKMSRLLDFRRTAIRARETVIPTRSPHGRAGAAVGVRSVTSFALAR
jgi:hypothetical protein